MRTTLRIASCLSISRAASSLRLRLLLRRVALDQP
jgi:hypothetical protein